jgi:hypothetical protein
MHHPPSWSDAVPLSFELRLEERQPDRVILSVTLDPRDAPMTIDGLVVELFSRDEESLSPRMFLPIAGRLVAPLAIRVELRCHQDDHSSRQIPPGSRVIGTVWWDRDQIQATCPADPGTELEVHLRGRRCVAPPDEAQCLRSLTHGERAQLACLFPWIACEAPRAQEEPGGPLDAFDLCDEITDTYGLCAEDAELLRELLEEDEV